jgi:hypothetical protein
VTDTALAAARKALQHPRTRPWLVVAAELPATFTTHYVWGNSALAGAGLTLAAGAVTAATWFASQGSTHQRRVHATATAALATGYLVIGTATNPYDPTLVSTLVIGGATLAGTWNIRQVLRVNPDTKAIEKAPAEAGILTKSIGAAKVLLRGKPKVEANKVTAELQLAPGELSTDELGNRTKQIAGELGVSANSIKILPDPDRADRATLIVVPEDMLKKTTPWPGPSCLGDSITEPVEIGIYEDGEVAVLWFPAGPGRNATHFLTAGMNGAGKSAGQSVAITEVLTRRDVIVWAIDPSKGLQTFAPFLPYLDWVEMTMSGGEAMIAALGQVITARANEMGKHGYKNWTPEVYERLAMPYMVVWIEEAAKFFREGTEMEGLVMEARSAGISVIISLQRPSATSMPTDVREQLGGALVFGVKGSTTADMALPEDVRDAGARPEVWQNRKPGYCYLVAPGVDEERYPFPIRTYYITDDQIEGTLALAPRPTADPVTARAAGEAYANRAIHLPDSVYTTPTSTNTITDEEQHDIVDDEEQRIQAAVDRELVLDGADDDGSPSPDVDPEQEIAPPATVWSFGQAPPVAAEVTTEQALGAVLLLLEAFRNEGRSTVGPKDFMPHLPAIGRSRAWLSPQLADLGEAGVHLQPTGRPGEYHLLDPQFADA